LETDNRYAARRRQMVLDQIADRGVHDARVLDAIGKVAREEFVPEHLRDAAYYDEPLPIGEGQTISQPYIAAFMAEALRLSGPEKVLEIGTGSGYAAAVLSHLASEVYTIERIPTLAIRARATLQRLGYRTVHVIEADGSVGWPATAPYDAIVATAEGPRIPPSLIAQLKPGGRLVMPVCDEEAGQSLVRLTRAGEGPDVTEKLLPVRFVPLIGAEGWSLDQRSPMDHLGLHRAAGGSPEK
jgi:protein-L-isoaspartate(D-aspartate) O-methyltransferase